MKSALLATLALALYSNPALALSSQDVVLTSATFTPLAAPGAPSIEARLASVVEDDRCPTRVLCAWAGPSLIEIEVRSADASARLTLSSKRGAAAHFLGWSLELLYLEPQPQEPEEFQKLKPLGAYRAFLRGAHP